MMAIHVSTTLKSYQATSVISVRSYEVLGQSGDVVFSANQNLPGSVKCMERQHGGCREKLILKRETTKRPPDWKLFLSNDANKIQLIRLLLRF